MDPSGGKASPTASSDGDQEDDMQDGYIVEALDGDYIVPEYVYDDALDGDDSKTNDDSGIDPTLLPGPSNQSRESKRVKLSEGATNFILNGQFYRRKFVGETSGALIATRKILGNTVNDILTGIWEASKSVLCREVVFIENNGVQVPTWADEEPVFEDMNKFIVLQDQSQKKRVNIDKVKSKLLASWRSKEIRVHVHVYSTSVSCKSLWEAVEKQLVRHQNSDRSGAPSNQAVTLLAEELRRKHINQFQGQSSAWRLWANYIHAGPAHERERRTFEMPPQHLLKFFRSVPISKAVTLESVRSGLSVANTINQGFSSELEALEEDADQLLCLAQRLKNRIANMRARTALNSSLVGAMSSAVRPEENEFSRVIAENVSDMLDVDHM
ncbi:hypothetical protein RP20_CCG014797 [Aedes albopictus]|nr:hypothetical protein RP20_CCG014797 [Aedes albopictus]